MISSSDEFRRLRTSHDLDEQSRASLEPAAEGVWIEIIARFPELRQWVAHNKTVPLDVLRTLAADPDPGVRIVVASKRKLDRELFELLAQDREPTVRSSVAWNRKAPADVIARLASDPDALVARAVAERA